MNQKKDIIYFLETNFGQDLTCADNALDEDSAFWKELKLRLYIVIEKLLLTNHQKLLDILYRIDVPEAHVNYALGQGTPKKISEEIVERIIQRQMSKVEYRKKMSKGN